MREKELGSIINFYVTPTGRLGYLIGKQLPYIAIGMINFFVLAAIALLIFGVSIKGSFLMLTLCTLLYVIVTTGVGMLTASFTIYLTRPVTEGTLHAVGRVVHQSRSLFLGEAELHDDAQRLVARGNGSFMRSSISLSAVAGYA